MAREAKVCAVVEDGVLCGRRHHGRGMCKMHHWRWFKLNRATVAPRTSFTSAEEGFWAYATPGDGPEDHWRWSGPLHSGYPAIHFARRRVGAHVFACEMLNGPRPAGGHALHKCGPNSWCVNPNHLAWGTPAENAMDRATDGTGPRGVRNGRAKLSEDDVLAIYRSTDPANRLARVYGVHKRTVSDIRTGRIWRWLTESES